jgi:MFS family permease
MAESLFPRCDNTGSGRIITPPFAVLCAAAFAEFLGVGMVIPVLPRFVINDLSRSSFDVGLAVGIFAVGALACRPKAGQWGDERGRRPLIVTGLLLTAAASAGVGLLPNFSMLLLLRIVAGVGQALFFIGSATTAADIAPEERRGEALSLFSLPVYLGLGLGPAIGEAILHADGAAWAFVVAGGTPLLALLLTPWLAEAPPASRSAVDAGGTSARWVHPAALAPGIVMLLGLVGFIGFQAYLPLYADDIHLRNVQVVFLTYAVLVMLTRVAGAKVPDRLGSKRTAAYANVLIGSGLAFVASVPHPWAVYAGVVPLAVGMAMQYPALIALALSGPPEQERARVVSTFSAFFDVAQVTGGLILGAAASGLGNRAVFAGGAISAAFALAVLVGVPRARRPLWRAARVFAQPEAWAPPGAE